MVFCIGMRHLEIRLLRSLILAAVGLLLPALASAQPAPKIIPVSRVFPISPPGLPKVGPALGGTPDGGFLVSWRSEIALDPPVSVIELRRIDAAGAPEGDAQRVESTPINQSLDRPSIAVNAVGVSMVAWQVTSSTPFSDFSPLRGRIFDPSGAAIGPEVEIASHGRRPRVAALGLRLFVVVWDNAPDDISSIEPLARIYDVAGGEVTPEPPFRVARRHGFPSQVEATVAADADARFVVVWTRANLKASVGIAGRLFGPDGVPLGDEFPISGDRSVQQPAVAFGLAGGFTVVWNRAGAIFGARFDDAGHPRGPSFTISAGAGEARTSPVITFDPAGRSVVAWGRSVLPRSAGQVFDASGRAVGPHFLFGPGRLADPTQLQLAFLADGRLAAVWTQATSSGGPPGIFGRLFALTLP
jgi:hypothetical protein